MQERFARNEKFNLECYGLFYGHFLSVRSIIKYIVNGVWTAVNNGGGHGGGCVSAPLMRQRGRERLRNTAGIFFCADRMCQLSSVHDRVSILSAQR